MTYYVIDTRYGEIINAIEVDHGPAPTIDPRHWTDAEHLIVKPESQVPLPILQQYRYWNERP